MKNEPKTSTLGERRCCVFCLQTLNYAATMSRNYSSSFTVYMLTHVKNNRGNQMGRANFKADFYR